MRTPRRSAAPLALLMAAAAFPWIALARPAPAPRALVQRLSGVRERARAIEAKLVESARVRGARAENLARLRRLLELQTEERRLSRERIADLEAALAQLEARRLSLGERARAKELGLRRSLGWALRGARGASTVEERARGRAGARLASQGLRELEELRADLEDADHLEARIAEERAQLQSLQADLREQLSVLELNRRLQSDLMESHQAERLAQLDRYRKVKEAESEVERLIGDFNARLELEHSVATEREAERQMRRGEFARARGRLPWPVGGPVAVLGVFGQARDAQTGIQWFRKGVELRAAAVAAPVAAVAAGKVAYAGVLAKFGRVVIVDHGEQSYTLFGQLGRVRVEPGQAVSAGEVLGEAGRDATGQGSLYFEVRQRSLPVDPIAWLAPQSVGSVSGATPPGGASPGNATL